MSNREDLVELGYADSIVFENPDYDEAIMGVTDDGNVVYDYDLMIEHLIANDNMTVDEAADFISFNTIRTLPYINGPRPIIVYRLLK